MSLYNPSLPWWVAKQNGQTKPLSAKAAAATEYTRDTSILKDLMSLGSEQRFGCLDGNSDATFAYCLDFNKDGKLAIGQENGEIVILDTSNDCNAYIDIHVNWQAHRNAIYDLKWTDNHTLLSVSGDSTLKHFHIEKQAILFTAKPPKLTEYQGCIKCVSLSPESSSKFVTAGRDNAITYWDIRAYKPNVINSIRYCHKPRVPKKSQVHCSKAGVTDLKFLDENHIVSCSDLDGILKIWDLRMSYDRYTGLPKCKHRIPYAGKSSLIGYSSLAVNSAKTKVYASCQDHVIYCFDVAQCDTIKPEKIFTGHSNGSRFYTKISLSIDDQYLLSGSADNKAYIYSTSFNAPSKAVGRLKGHDNDVTCVAFSKQRSLPLKIATCSDDFDVKVWSKRPMMEKDRTMRDGEFERVASFSDYMELSDNYVCDIENKKSADGNSPKRRRLGSPLSELTGNCQPKNLDAFPCMSPSKLEISPAKRFNNVQPSKISITPKRKLNFSPSKKPWKSPTVSLPNFVADGISPHDQKDSPSKPKRQLDWLSALSRMKQVSIGSSTRASTSSKPGKKRKDVPKN